MKFIEQKLPGVFIIQPEGFADHRGMFRRQFCQREFTQAGINIDIRQTNISENTAKHTLRGFHYQKPPHLEGKLITCIGGAFYDIVVDLRPESPTYLQWISLELNVKNRLSVYVAPGCANAYLTLEDNTWLHYSHSEFYTPGSEGGIRYNDPLFNFTWPHPHAVISDKDKSHPDYVPVKKA